jgi:hypothetical protein
MMKKCTDFEWLECQGQNIYKLIMHMSEDELYRRYPSPSIRILSQIKKRAARQRTVKSNLD